MSTGSTCISNCNHTARENFEGHELCRECGIILSVLTTDIEWIPGINDVRERGSSGAEDWHPTGTCVGDKSLKRLHMGMSNGNKARVYFEGRDIISNVCTDLQIGNAVQSEALSLFSCVEEQHGRWRGAKRLGILIACVSLACQKLSVGISDASILQLQRVQQPTRVINSAKKQVLIVLHKNGQTIDQATASEFCFRICVEMGFQKNITTKISRHAARISKMEHLNARACNMIVAISILFFVEKSSLTLNIMKLCHTVRVTRPTLVKWYAEGSKRDMSITRTILHQLDSANK
jgi:transcription initiation factor TFIIIB Brf1 subunit/transcription initiation factor TFIIB